MVKNKYVVISAETWRLLVERAGELQAKTRRRVYFDDAIQVALRLLDTEAAAKLILGETQGKGEVTRNAAGA